MLFICVSVVNLLIKNLIDIKYFAVDCHIINNVNMLKSKIVLFHFSYGSFYVTVRHAL